MPHRSAFPQKRVASIEQAIALIENLERLGRPSEAEAICDSVLAGDPFEGPARLGWLRYRQKRFEDAVSLFRKALHQRRRSPDVQNCLGMALRALGRLDEAMKFYKKAIAARPDFAEAHNNLANLLQDMGRETEAVEHYQMALRLKPDYPDALRNIARAMLALGSGESAVAYCRSALTLRPDFAVAHSDLIFYLNFVSGMTTHAQQRDRKAWWDMHGRQWLDPARRFANVADPDRQLRVGYVSAGFCRQAATYAFGPVILDHDRRLFRAFLYSDTVREDDITVALRGCGAWRSIVGLNDNSVAEMIVSDRIDILVDLSGHMGGNRLTVFARKPAPLQVTAWGEPTGTGLATMDYLFADPVLVPLGLRGELSETVIDLPCFIAHWTPDRLPPVGPLPATLNGYVTFGSFNRPQKITAAVLSLWGELLRAVPRSRLVIKHGVLKGPSQETRIRHILAQEGVAAERIALFGGTQHHEHMAAYQGIDIALDPFPHSGGMTTLEALCMGIPVITCPGETISSRLAAACLCAVGLQEFIAEDRQGYIDLAASTAANLEALAQLRHSLRERIAGTPVGDHSAYRRAVESAYQQIWRRWCKNQPLIPV